MEKKTVPPLAQMAPQGSFCYQHRYHTQAAIWRAAIRKLGAQHFLICEWQIGLFSIFSEIENSGISCFGEHLRTSRLQCGTRRLFRGGIRSLVSGVGLLTMFGPTVRSKCPINSEGLCPFLDQGNRSRGGGNEGFQASGVEDRLGNFASVRERVADALGIRQGGVYRLEQRCNFLISALGSYI